MPLLERYNMYLEDRAFLATGGERLHVYTLQKKIVNLMDITTATDD